MSALLAALAFSALAPSTPQATAGQARGQIRIDGVLDEAAWKDAPVHDIDVQKVPVPGARATLPTSWRVLAGERSLYVGIRCEHDERTPVVARRTRRDREIESDLITVDLDTRGKGRDAFHFAVTAGGTVADAIRFNDTEVDMQWDAAWDAAVSSDDSGWTAEIEIPYRVLRRPANAAQPVRIQVRRYVSVLGEIDEWAPTPRDSSQEVSRYGELEGFELPSRKAWVEVVPYGSIGMEVETGTNAAPEPIKRAGGDLKLRIGADATLDAAVYPDFGNVEADEAAFNLDTVELRFPEKRPFFLEGTDVLATPLEVFYSRRIGSLTGTTAGTTLETPPPAPVLGAAKLVARLGRKWSLASLAATTGPQDVRVRDPDAGHEADQRVAPTYTYGVLRARRDLPHAGFVGLTGTTRFGFDRGPREPWTTCPDGEDPAAGACFADVHLLSADTRTRSANGTWVGTTQVVGTYRHGGTSQTGPDGNTLSSGDIGPAAHARIDKVGGRLVGYLHYEYFGRDADYNATGYLAKPNRHNFRGHFALQELEPHGPVLDDRWQMEIFHRLSLDGVPLGSGYQLNYRAKWRSYWSSFTELLWRPGHFDNREARDGTPVERAGLVGMEQSIATDHRRALMASGYGEYFHRENGPHLEGHAALDWNVVGPLQLHFQVKGTLEHGEPRWMATDTDAGVYRLGRLEADAVGFITRVNYTVTPKLELQLYGQLLGVTTRFTEGYVMPLGADRIYLDALLPDPSFVPTYSREALLVANFFVRWEYALGSNLYLVVTRNQLDPDDPDPADGFDFSPAVRNAAAYTFLVKTTVLIGR